MKIDDTHPDYKKRLPQWTRCADAIEGADAIRAGGTKYLPKLPAQTDSDYNDYQTRAVWKNATAKTLDMFTGLVEPEKAKIEGASEDVLEDADLAGKPFPEVIEDALEHVIGVGRFGILVDYSGMITPDMSQAEAEKAGARAYVAAYTAQQITNWHKGRHGGRMVLDRVVLKEQAEVAGVMIDQFRELLLEDVSDEDNIRPVYHSHVWRLFESTESKQKVWKIVSELDAEPLMGGSALDFIPFFFFDPEYGAADPVTPPLLDLVDVNLSHFRTMADLENGRFFLGLPTPVFCGFGDMEGKIIKLGSTEGITSTDPAAKAYYLEFTGAGMAILEGAAKQKEEWMAQLGGGLLDSDTEIAETAETARIKRSGANATLGSMASAVAAVATKVLALVMKWTTGADIECSVVLNTDYLPGTVDASTIAALLQAVQSGDFRRRDFLAVLKQGGQIAPDVDLEAVDKELGDNAAGTLAIGLQMAQAAGKAAAASNLPPKGQSAPPKPGAAPQAGEAGAV